MEKTKADVFLERLRSELQVAMGCTEPACVALTAATAQNSFGLEPEKIVIRASRDMIKNVMHVGLPNSDLKGISAAAALGIVISDPFRGLNILSSLNEEDTQRAAKLLGERKISVELAEGAPPVYVSITLKKGEKEVTAVAKDFHTNVRILMDGEREESFSQQNMSEDKNTYSLDDIYEFACTVPLERISFLLDCAKVNLELSEFAIKKNYGISVGRISCPQDGDGMHDIDSLFAKASSYASAASDARMAGCPMPVVINSGSGNQGITISVPLLVLGKGLSKSEEEIIRALALSHLTALMLTDRKGRLSALCGAFTASIGTAVGYVYLLSGTLEQMKNVSDLMVANLIGLLCDGAKGSCALKIHSCLDGAALSCKIVMAGNKVPAGEGVLGYSSDDTLDVIERISRDGMVPLDKTVLSLLIEHNRKRA